MSNLPDFFKSMTLTELADWSRGHVLIEIGKGKYESAVYYALSIAWARGFEEGKQAGSDALAVEHDIQRQFIERLGVDWPAGEPFYSVIELYIDTLQRQMDGG